MMEDGFNSKTLDGLYKVQFNTMGVTVLFGLYWFQLYNLLSLVFLSGTVFPSMHQHRH